MDKASKEIEYNKYKIKQKEVIPLNVQKKLVQEIEASKSGQLHDLQVREESTRPTDWVGNALDDLRRRLPEDDPLRRRLELPEPSIDVNTQAENQTEHLKITYIKPESDWFFRNFLVADVLDPLRLSKELNEALKVKEPEKVYRALQSLQCEPEAIEKLNITYQTLYSSDKDLQQLLEEHFTEARREYALHLINRGREGAMQAIEQVPSSYRDFKALSERIHNALESSQVTPEDIYAALTPLQRNTKLLIRLGDFYHRQYQSHLHADLCKMLDGSSLDYALYLMGDQKMEVPIISQREVKCLYQAISKLAFMFEERQERKKVIKRARLPYHNPTGSCADRAHVISEVLKELGYSSQKVFVVSAGHSKQEGDLQLSTYYADDMEITQESTEEWWYHVAPCICFDNELLKKHVEIVIDPGIYDLSRHTHELLTIDKLAKQISLRECQNLSIKELEEMMKEREKEHLVNEYGSYHPGKTYVFTCDRGQFYAPPLHHKDFERVINSIPDEYVYGKYREFGENRLKNQKNLESYCSIAAVIRQHYWENHISRGLDINEVNELFRYIDKTDPDKRSQFPDHYPKLYRSFKDLLSSSMAEKFEKLFSI